VGSCPASAMGPRSTAHRVAGAVRPSRPAPHGRVAGTLPGPHHHLTRRIDGRGPDLGPMNRDAQNAAERRSRPARGGVSVGSMTNTVPSAPYTPPAITSRQPLLDGGRVHGSPGRKDPTATQTVMPVTGVCLPTGDPKSQLLLAGASMHGLAGTWSSQRCQWWGSMRTWLLPHLLLP